MRWHDQKPKRHTPRGVFITIDLNHYFPPGFTAPTNTLNHAHGSPIKVDGAIRGRLVSNLNPRGTDGRYADALAIVDLDDRELDLAFPNGYVIDPSFIDPT